MNGRHILFRTNKFNLSEVKPHFINPCCFGEDLAAWLGNRLAEKQIAVSVPGQEDWGWYITATYGRNSYFLGVGGNADEDEVSRNEGEWRIIIQKKRSLWQRLTGKGKITTADAMVQIVEAILRGDSEFRDIHFEN
jgi:hypothetical protein